MINQHKISIVQCRYDHLSRLKDFLDTLDYITNHTVYTYWVAFDLFKDLFFIAEDEDKKICGFIFGMQRDNIVFIWQIGVSQELRKRGIAMQLTQRFHHACQEKSIKKIIFTINPKNKASISLFEKFALLIGCKLVEVGRTGNVGGNMIEQLIFELSLDELRVS